MSTLALRVCDIGKRYQLGSDRQLYATLREQLAGLVDRARHARPQHESADTLWALRNVSFEVPHGEVLGIIGRNGAGKSTLLKMLSRITAPTEGWAEVYGRVGSLLEVGTGFHPELTGRENVYLNGAILGMPRAEIARNFDAIIDFAEIGRFVDTPVKRYSSGMYVRLAFAVAAHLEPEILIIDEVLAVGDAAFQTKCLGKVHDVARGGRTVLFVSHNLAAIQRLCSSAILLDGGRIAAAGEVSAVVAAYLGGHHHATYSASRRTGKPQILTAALCTADGAPLARAVTTEALTVSARYVLPDQTPGVLFGIALLAADGTHIFTSNVRDVQLSLPSQRGEYETQVTIPANVLLAGDFHISLCLSTEREIFDLQEPGLSLAVDPGPSPLYALWKRRKGVIQVPCAWRVAPADDSPSP